MRCLTTELEVQSWMLLTCPGTAMDYVWARGSWCLHKLIHLEGGNAVIYFIVVNMAILDGYNMKITLEILS